MKDYYSLLGVKPDATVAQIDAAYRRLVQRYHPNARSSPQALERLRELNEAWRVLSDATQRAAYDRSRKDGTTYQPPTPPPTLRNVPQANLGEFGARRRKGGTCLIAAAVTFALLVTFSILAWGLNEQLDFGARFERAMGEVNALLPTSQFTPTQVAEQAVTPTPDPRCRDGCETPPPGCVVKGVVDAQGKHYFYLPNDEGYARARVVLANGDRWFCALSDAQADGWVRKAPTETPTLPPPPEAFTTPVARHALNVCAENVTLFQGPGENFPMAQAIENGARVFVTGVNGEWSVVNQASNVLYVRSVYLCAPPTRVAAPVTATARQMESPTSAALTNASPAGATFKYSAPQLLLPTFGAKYWCVRELILQWEANAALAPEEFFLVESKLVEHDRWVALADWTKDTTVTLFPNRGGGVCDTVWWDNTGVYEWRVSIVRGNKDMPTYLSPFSESFRINYSK